jgi:hypothetical protein
MEVHGSLAETTASLSRVAGVGRQAPVLPSPNGLLPIEDSWRPRWAGMLAVALSPFGLVALMYRRRGQMVISMRPACRRSSMHRLSALTWPVAHCWRCWSSSPLREC